MASQLDLNNVQGDILAGLPKKSELCFFFQIDDARVQAFRIQLAKLVPLISTTTQVLNDYQRILQNKKSAAEREVPPELLEMSGVNIAFTHKGLQKIGIQDDLGDSAFNGGMLADAQKLGDKATSPSGTFDPDWIPEFKQEIHGLILITGNCAATINGRLAEIKTIFQVGFAGASIHEVLSLVGDVRPGDEAGHEHFGFQDGISQPAVKDVDTNPLPGQQTVHQGIILLGREGDATPRPSWALDGSFLCFRYLFQLVPEFDLFLKQHAIPIPDPSAPPELGSELLGARLIGRWKSGAPIDLTPLGDDPSLGADPLRNNNFRYDQEPLSQTRCPFAAHTRKTNPRADLDFVPPSSPFALENRRIIRRGIPFGPEVGAEEAAVNATKEKRGLLFVAYQSSITKGFQFIQKSWANNPQFPPKPPPSATPALPPPSATPALPQPGFDAIIGQVLDQNNEPAPRALSGTIPDNPNAELLSQSEQWVVPKGGEYFFSPSIVALKNTFALAA